jgi:putative transposase
MMRAHKIRLNPTAEQDTYFMQAAGPARYAYNWAVAAWREVQGTKPTALELKKQFNAQKPAWAYEVTQCAAEGAFTDLGTALTNFDEKRAEEPRFKKRSQGHFGFKLNHDKFEVVGHWVKIPKLGLVNMAEKLRYTGKIMGAVISREADGWSISIHVERPDQPTLPQAGECGLDAGLLRLATLSDGTFFENLRPLRSLLDRLATLQRVFARKQLGSRHRARLKAKIARLHKRIRNIRHDILHKLTTWMAEHYGFVAVEDLHVKGLTQNHCLALSLSDAALGHLLDLLESKVLGANAQIVKVDRFFPSSKRCVNCNHKRDDLTLSDRIFVCPNCAFTADRDHNAAMTILKEGLRLASRRLEQSDQASSGSGYDGRKTPPQTGYNLDTHSGKLAMSDHVCRSER